MPYRDLKSEAVQRREAQEIAKAERERKRKEREEFWAEYKRRLDLRDARKEEMCRILGFHSTVKAGTLLVSLPDPTFAPTIAVRGNRPAVRRKAPTGTRRRHIPTIGQELSQKRQIHKGKGR